MEQERQGGERRDARENRERLLEAAKQLFAAGGAEATSMASIARAAGVGQGTLYRHFADKAAICHALIGEDIATFQAQIAPAIAAGSGAAALDRLDRLLCAKIELTESHLPLFATMDSAGGMKRMRPFQGLFYLWQRAQLIALLEEAATLGEADPLDPPLIADAILAATAPPLYRHQREDLGYPSVRILAALRQVFVAGLRRQR